MADKSSTKPQQPSANRISKPYQQRKKLPPLPQNTRISKRPLLRPPIPSPHTNSSQPKVIYISAKTPFLPAVKRVEKLLHLADKRDVQSATTIAKQQRQKGGKRGKRGDELLEIAQVAERQRQDRVKAGDAGAGEEVLLKGTGKAVQRVLELGLWFQQREERFVVRLRTGSVGAVDDVEVMQDAVAEDKHVTMAEEVDEEDKEGGEGQAMAGADDHDQRGGEGGGIEVSGSETAGLEKPAQDLTKMKGLATKSSAEPIPETRIRYTSSLEVSIRRT